MSPWSYSYNIFMNAMSEKFYFFLNGKIQVYYFAKKKKQGEILHESTDECTLTNIHKSQGEYMVVSCSDNEGNLTNLKVLNGEG